MIMFYKVVLERLVTVPPEKLDGTLQRHLLRLLQDAVVGQLMTAPISAQAMRGDYRSAVKSSATVLAVIDILGGHDLQGKVLDNGSVAFPLRYEALVLKVHRGEVIDVRVVQATAEGWWGTVFGVGNVFVSQSQMSADPSRPEWVFESGLDGSWVNSRDPSKSVKVQDVVRVRVLSETPQSTNAMVIGTMIGSHLGPL